jgi:hypothetical protein
MPRVSQEDRRLPVVTGLYSDAARVRVSPARFIIIMGRRAPPRFHDGVASRLPSLSLVSLREHFHDE